MKKYPSPNKKQRANEDLKALQVSNLEKDQLLEENRIAMKELKNAFHEMRNEWKGREAEFDRLLKQLNDATSPEKAFEVRQRIMEEQQAQGRAHTPPTMKHVHVEPSI